MKWIFKLLILVGLGVALTYYYPSDHGEIFLRLPGSIVPPFKTTPVVFFGALLIALFLLSTLFQLSFWVIALPWSVGSKFAKYRHSKHEEKLLTGWSWYASGGYSEALKIAEKLFKSKCFKNEAALLATNSNLMMHKTEKAEEWLEKVDNPKARLLLLNSICKVQLHLRKEEADEAMTAIREVEKASGFNSVVGRMKIAVYEMKMDWDSMLKVASVLNKKGLVADVDYQKWVLQARLGELDKLETETGNALFKWWKKLPDSEKFNDIILNDTLNLLVHHKDFEYASEIIEKLVTKKISGKQAIPAKVYSQYAEVVEDKRLKKSIKLCQKWLETEKNNPALLRATARLCEREMLWGNAISYYEASLSFEEDKSAIKALAKIYEETDQTDKASDIRTKLLSM